VEFSVVLIHAAVTSQFKLLISESTALKVNYKRRRAAHRTNYHKPRNPAFSASQLHLDKILKPTYKEMTANPNVPLYVQLPPGTRFNHKQSDPQAGDAMIEDKRCPVCRKIGLQTGKREGKSS
jgi:hypothetical protein